MKTYSDFVAWRKAQKRASLGAIAIASFSPSHAETKETARFISATVSARSTDDEISDDETRGVVTQLASLSPEARETPNCAPIASASYSLSPAERRELCAVRPGSRSLILRSTPPAPIEEGLPADYVPRTVSDYVPRLIRDAVIEEQAAREAAIEVAAIEEWDRVCDVASQFDSQWGIQYFPEDYAPKPMGAHAVSRSICAALGGMPEGNDNGLVLLEGGARKESVCPMESLRLAVLAM